MNPFEVKLVPGTQGPLYEDGTQELKSVRIVVTEQGTEKNLPIVDFVMKGEHGEQYLLVLTGRHVLMLGAIIRGINTRIHGNPEP